MTQNIPPVTAVSFDEFIHAAMLQCNEAGYSFALWKLPDNQAYQFAASLQPEWIHDVNLEESKPGFLFSPFDPGEKKLFLPADEFFSYESGQITSMTGTLPEGINAGGPSRKNSHKKNYHTLGKPAGSSNDSNSYQKLVALCRESVLQSQFEKIVPSRCKQVMLSDNFDVASIFLALGTKYPSAMISVFSSPLTGTWIGASPEMLVRLDSHQHFHTAAVAGTQRFVEGVDIRTITWTQKEIEEQALVERYIINCFKKIRLREFEEHGPRTVVAGNVVHLKTEFEVDMVATRYPQLGSVMLQLLHPTSAVCGMPLEASLRFLKEHEEFNRQFYSGFLGPVNIRNESHLYVNLRCMQLFGQVATVYAGAGVLGDSDPEKEWNETELKMNTLLEVIRR